MPTDCTTLVAACNALLQPERFKDYGPNGLQVQGRRDIRTLVSGVTASRALIEAAIDARADAILVHHGLFWRGQDGTVTGWLRERLRLLLAHDIHLLAYHLPLDAHPTLGNNAQLGRVLGLAPLGADAAPSTGPGLAAPSASLALTLGPAPATPGRFGDQQLGMIGQRADGGSFASPQALAQHVQQRLKTTLRHVFIGDIAIKKIAWCSGGAQGYFEAAIAAGAQAFITGEISEPQAHLARECGVTYIACGHHASERYGAPAVGAYLGEQLGLAHRFIEVDNPA